jgi:hypothetical protein
MNSQHRTREHDTYFMRREIQSCEQFSPLGLLGARPATPQAPQSPGLFRKMIGNHG